MLTLQKPISIKKDTASRDDLDFDFLRKSGIAYIEALGSKLWTDYNTHDPGITLLEALCYAITDLGQRMSLPVEALLAKEEENGVKQFHEASAILGCSPVTHLVNCLLTFRACAMPGY